MAKTTHFRRHWLFVEEDKFLINNLFDLKAKIASI